MATKAPAFQLYARDFYIGTSGMTAAEVGVYIRALVWSWDNGPLPQNVTKLSRILFLSCRQMGTIWEHISEKFVLTDVGFINVRLEEEREKQATFRAKQALKGKASAKQRFNRGSTVVQPSLVPDGQPPSASASSVRSRSSAAAKSAASVSSGDDPQALMEAWNTLTTKPIPRCRELTAKRKRAAMARLAERDMAEWRHVIDRIQQSAFCRGDGTTWVASFDWLLQPDVAVKVLEGKYDNRAVAHTNGRPTLGVKAVTAARQYLDSEGIDHALMRPSRPSIVTKRPTLLHAEGEE